MVQNYAERASRGPGTETETESFSSVSHKMWDLTLSGCNKQQIADSGNCGRENLLMLLLLLLLLLLLRITPDPSI